MNYPVAQPARKKKWIAGSLAFFVPGIGHMYLGLMVKAIVIMLLIAMNILGIVYVSIDGDNVLSIVLLSLLMPIIYFYSLFDAIQSTEAVNERKFAQAALATQSLPPYPPSAPFVEYPPGEVPAGRPQQSVPLANGHLRPNDGQTHRSFSPLGMILLVGAGVVLLGIVGDNFMNRLFRSSGAMVGAVLLVGAGIALWIWENRADHRKGS
ncbi:hypothetical protein ACFPPD_07670 [Cohnella suwonensis]|uniref:TM2 domain-containing protein n=1 Tax=Cohnella suwonensis TaxID=696072 RepID=A0ABW0LTF8_9BACL